MLIRKITSLLGTGLAWRLGRALYLSARGDVPNDMSTNGERMVQRCVLAGLRNRAESGRGLVVFDVGANVGDWSRCLLEEMRDPEERSRLSLHLFEPVPDTFGRLSDRLAKAGEGASLRLHPLALSSGEGKGEIFVRGIAGSNSLHPDTEPGDATPVPIARTTADRFCAEHAIDRIHLMKIDTEGHDMEVISGAMPLLRAGAIRVVQFEYNHRWVFSRHYLKDVFDAVEGLPYRIGKVQADHVALFSGWHPELERFFEANYLLVHESALGWFETRELAPDGHNVLVRVGPKR